jgi:hypothetical protein
MPESTKPMTQEIRLTVTPATVETLCARIRALAREGALRIVYVADPDAAWDETAIELWRREHERLATWMVGARSAGQKLPELPAWQAIERSFAREASPTSPDAGDRIPEIAQRLLAAQVAAVREVRTASRRPAPALPVAHPLAKAALLAAAVTGMAACQSNGPMNVKTDASNDTNQTLDVGIGGGICAIQIDRDALGPAEPLPSGTDDASDGGLAIDGDQADTADAYVSVGGLCPAPIGGIC